MGSAAIDIAQSHPMFDAVCLANRELETGRSAAAEGNLGRVRVCARRAVGAFLQSIAPTLNADVGTNAMANLRWLQSSPGIRDEQRLAAERLAGGARTEKSGGIISADPLAD